MNNYSFNKKENNRYTYYEFEALTYDFRNNSFFYNCDENIVETERFTVASEDYDKLMQYAKEFEASHGSGWKNYDTPWYVASYARCSATEYAAPPEEDGSREVDYPKNGWVYKIRKVELEHKNFGNNSYIEQCRGQFKVATHSELETEREPLGYPSYHSYDVHKDLNLNEYDESKKLNS